jgi:hypothetical protein
VVATFLCRLRAYRPGRRAGGEEHRLYPRRRRPADLQVAGHGLAGIVHQRERFSTAALAADDELARPPAHVRQLQAAYPDRARTVPFQEHQHCVIPAPGLAPAIAAIQQRTDRGSIQPYRKARRPLPRISSSRGTDREPGREVGERLALAQVRQHEQSLLAGVQLPPPRPGRLAVPPG